MTLRVGYDVTCQLSGSTGVARYAAELAAALEASGEVELARFAIGRGPISPPAGTRHLRVPLRVLHESWRRIGRPRVDRLTGPVDLVHATDLVPGPSRAPTVVTIHDLAAVDLPALHPPRATAMQQAQLDAARRAQAVLAVSEATAAALRRHGVAGERIFVTPNGATALPAPGPSPVAGDFLLGVGALAARKGWDVLIDAVSRAAVDGVRLVIAGPDGFGAERVRAAAASAGPGRVELLGPVDDRTLASLYAAAVAVCVPSHEEGFGLVALEACAAARPVLASDIPVLREVAEGAAVFVPAADPAAWAEALRAALDDRAALDRSGASGPDVAARFTWARTAASTIAAYRTVLGGPR